MFHVEQSEFSASGSMGAAARIAEKLSIQVKSRRPWKLEVTESLRKGGKVQDRVEL